jgi:FkbM family methyltransferase
MIGARRARATLARARGAATAAPPVRRWREWRYRRLLTRLAGPRLLRAFAEVHPRAFFIEIGANDGQGHDHLRPLILSHEWRGIMVEPVPYVFERLRRNYEALDRISLVNAAIADRDGTRPFYHLGQAGPREREALPEWYDAIGSLSRETVVAHRHKIPELERRLVATEVRCLTLASLCRKHGVEEVDLLVTDTEGYDEQILGQLDFEAIRPRLIVYEHFHLAPQQRARCAERLRDAGYELLEEAFDSFCLDRAADERLLRLWRSLRPAVPAASVHEETR